MTNIKTGQNNNKTSPSLYFGSNQPTNLADKQENGTKPCKFTQGGIILLNKPRHLSSNTAVNIVKRAVSASKAGHLGTLDVEAEGLLPITLNSATRLFDMFLHKDKEYLTTIKFGEERDTFDLEGQITRTDDKIITAEQIQAVLPLLQGKQKQLPPAYSAKKIGGRKAYDLAREGKAPILEPKEVTVYDFSLIKQLSQSEADELINKCSASAENSTNNTTYFSENTTQNSTHNSENESLNSTKTQAKSNVFQFKIACSSGTYVRALCRDLAEKLSTCAVCVDIIRTKCGIFDICKAETLEEIKAGNFTIISPEKLFNFEKIVISQTIADKLLNGQFIKTSMLNSALSQTSSSGQSSALGETYLSGEYRIYAAANDDRPAQFIGIGQIADGLLKLTLRLN